MDDASNEHYTMDLIDQQGTISSMQGVKTMIRIQGVFRNLHAHRSSHSWTHLKRVASRS